MPWEKREILLDEQDGPGDDTDVIAKNMPRSAETSAARYTERFPSAF
jgi:hypothetical protein